MPAPRIPDLALIHDLFTGDVIQVDDYFLLTDAAHHDVKTVASGTLVLRYGITYLGKPHLSIVPGLLALDYGAFKTGEDAWDFLLNKSNLYPRADVVGYDEAGEKQQVFIKELDLMYPFDVFVYTNESHVKPTHKVDAIISTSEGLAERLQAHINVFESLDAWREALS